MKCNFKYNQGKKSYCQLKNVTYMKCDGEEKCILYQRLIPEYEAFQIGDKAKYIDFRKCRSASGMIIEIETDIALIQPDNGDHKILIPLKWLTKNDSESTKDDE